MSFQSLGALLWLIPLAGIILLLYLLKMRRRNVRVPATFLWPAKVEEIRANALFQKLRPSWLLFLQLLALTLVVFALSRPQTMQRGLTGEVTVIVLDTSASMSATDVRPTRFDEAKRLAREAIQSARPGDRVALIEAGPTPKVVFPLGNDPARQVRALDALEVTHSDASVGDAMRLASALVGTIDGARIVLLSDGVFEPVSNFTRGKAALVYKAIGDSDENLSISALGVADTGRGRQLYCGVKNHSAKPIDGTLTIHADGKVIDSVKLPGVPPGGQWGRTIAAPPSGRVFEAFLKAPDVLQADNYAVTISDPGASLRVLLVTRGNPFLERALSLDPRVTLDRATELPLQERQGGEGLYDVVVFDGVPEEPVVARGVLTFGAAGGPSPVRARGSAARPQFVSSEAHPLLEGVSLRRVYIDRQEQVSPAGGGRVLAESSAGPLVVVAEKPGKRQVYVAFEAIESDFPLQVGFPIFVANALDFLGGAGVANAVAVKAGEPFSVPWTQRARLSGPEGARFDLDPVGGVLVVRETRRVGPYTLELGDKKKQLFAALDSERESQIAPVQSLPLGGGTVRATAQPMRFADFWRPLAMLALLVLAAEWWLFARRS